MESCRPENRGVVNLTQEAAPMSETNTVNPLRQHMIEDLAARKLNPHTQRSHIHSCKRFAAWLKRSPDTATPDEVRRFQLHLIESGTSICNRNRIMTGVRFLFRVTLRRHDLAAEVRHLKGAAEAAASAEPRGGQARPDRRDKPEGASDTKPHLWLRTADQRGGAATSRRHRQ
jgi:hypothetical protein